MSVAEGVTLGGSGAIEATAVTVGSGAMVGVVVGVGMCVIVAVGSAACISATWTMDQPRQ